MVDIKRRLIEGQAAIEIEVKLPFTPIYLLMNTKGFLCGKIFNRAELEKSKSCACIMEESRSANQLLNSCVVFANKRAQMQGICVGEQGSTAILKMYESSD